MKFQPMSARQCKIVDGYDSIKTYHVFAAKTGVAGAVIAVRRLGNGEVKIKFWPGVDKHMTRARIKAFGGDGYMSRVGEGSFPKGGYHRFIMNPAGLPKLVEYFYRDGYTVFPAEELMQRLEFHTSDMEFKPMEAMKNKPVKKVVKKSGSKTGSKSKSKKKK